MNIIDGLIAEYEHESQGTRRHLERVPDRLLDWKPTEKSMSFRFLASHLAEMPNWLEITLTTTELVFDDAYRPWMGGSTKEILERFDANLRKALAAMKGYPNDALIVPWSLKKGPQVIFTMPRVAVLRSMVFNHQIHHRAQLGVYLRLNGLPVPGVYGPSADEPM